ncbi:MAG: peptidase prolyl oligopeptidase active site domain protein [Gammaproteobacteria bacterium]|nr:peptidase prolyl oligopeptidase active site domain protein [Gammaproteobacteria bacterium]
MRIKASFAFMPLCLAAFLAGAAHAGQRGLVPDDYLKFADVTAPQVSPDGTTVAYVVTTSDRDSDEPKDAIWLTNWEGTEHRQLTRGESASQPKFSPDGRYLSFVSARPADSKSQIWLLDMRGAEPRQMTHVSGEVSSYAWSPDGKRIALVMSGTEEGGKTPKPIVIDTFHFKQDVDGYMTAQTRKHLYLLEVGSGALTALTTASEYNDDVPAWSPDGKLIAYVSNHRKDPEQSGVDEIYLVEARAGAVPRRLVEVFSPNHQRLAFSPDGKLLSLLQGLEPRRNAYITDRLAVVSVSDGHLRPLTDKLDRAVAAPFFSADGKAISVLVEDDGSNYPARVDVGTGEIERLIPGAVTAHDQSVASGHTAVLASSDTQSAEVFALENHELRMLTSHNEALLAEIKFGAVEDVSFKSRDGTQIHGQIVKPPSYVSGRKYPTILWIHGGPNGQDQHELVPESYCPPLERQLLAAQGYVVLAVNYRGSTGRGAKFARSIEADWGHKEVEDLLAGVDYAVRVGIADPARLGIGGWSYGGILTDYTIAHDTRFKAAIAGAGSGNQTGMWGLDEYALQYNAELGPPWKSTALYLKLSYPFYHADQIHTPTLFMGGDKDFNVPIAGGEQMYLALRTLGVPTQLVIYPGQFHLFTRPSFLKDRAERYIAWYAKYLPVSAQ